MPSVVERIKRTGILTIWTGAKLLKGKGICATVEQLAEHGETVCKILQGRGGLGDVGETEIEVAAILPLLPASGGVVFDGGANAGSWTRALLNRSGERVARVFAFEPASENIERLREITDARLEVVGAAIGKQKGTSILYSDAPGSSLASLYQRNLGHPDMHHEAHETIPVIALDDFAFEREIELIDFLKMDIEGNEYAALQGARQLLAERRIRALSFEIGPCNVNSRTFFVDYWRLLTEEGFHIFRIMPSGCLLPIHRYTERLEEFDLFHNYVAVLRDR